MMDIRTIRTTARIPGALVCRKVGITRSRLSDIERGHVRASEEEIGRISAALDELVQAKQIAEAAAAAHGWPTGSPVIS